MVETDVLLDDSKQRYQSLFHYNPYAVMEFDLLGNFVSANGACVKMSGYSVTELLQMTFHPLIYPDDARIAYEQFLLATHDKAGDYEVRIVAKDGRIVHLRITNVPVKVNQSVVGIYCIAKDITEHVKSQAMLTGQKRALEMIATGHSLIAILHTLCEWVKTVYPMVTCSLYTLEENEESLRHVAGQLPPQAFFQRIAEDSYVHGDWIEVEHEREYIACISKPLVHSSGRRMGLCSLHMPLMYSMDGGEKELLDVVIYVAGLAIERKETEKQIRQLAHYDPLTGLANRRLFLERLRSAWEYSKQTQLKFAVMFLDIDRFKSINDSLGHVVGDQILCVIGERLQASVRLEDTVARMGGDEFIILLPEVSNDEQAAGAARKILSTIEEPIRLEGHEFRMTTSIGIAIFPEHGEDTEKLLRNADVALYDAKRHGKNNFTLYRGDMNENGFERLILDNELRKGLKKQEFLLHFQPRVHIHSGEVSSAEALIRWNHPKLGMVSPGEFIPLAEETGFIIQLGRWVLEAVCRQIRTWADAGLQPVRIAVNVSARQFHYGLIDSIAQALHKFDVNPAFLEIEITETALMQNEDEATRTLSALQEMGIRVSIDDFGRGYSSLGFLQHFPIDALKIDQSFVREISGGKGAIVNAIITLAHSLNLQVVAEGVEENGQLEYLRQQHCDEMQGYLFSRPIPHDSFVHFLAPVSKV